MVLVDVVVVVMDLVTEEVVVSVMAVLVMVVADMEVEEEGDNLDIRGLVAMERHHHHL